jgi:hypothetical protein
LFALNNRSYRYREKNDIQGTSSELKSDINWPELFGIVITISIVIYLLVEYLPTSIENGESNDLKKEGAEQGKAKPDSTNENAKPDSSHIKSSNLNNNFQK